MAAYTLEEVTSRRATREFLDLPKRLYRDEPHWICPLDQDIENRFHPETNELLRDGEAIRWIVVDERGRVVGRIAACYNRELVAASEYQPTGGCGFFESIDDQRVADMLFDAARDWLKAVSYTHRDVYKRQHRTRTYSARRKAVSVFRAEAGRIVAAWRARVPIAAYGSGNGRESPAIIMPPIPR